MNQDQETTVTKVTVEDAPTQPTGGTDANASVAGPQPEPQTFPAEYVQELRAEAAKHRGRFKSLATELVHAWAAVDGRLVDATDLQASDVEADEDGNYSREAVTAAIDRLLKTKPHLASARPAPIPQGARPDAEQVSLLGLLNTRP